MRATADRRRPALRQLPGGPAQAYAAAAAALQAGAQMVKVEGGAWLAPTVEFLATRGVPVCGHVGLQPQSVNALGALSRAGQDRRCRAALLADSQALTAREPPVSSRVRAAGAGRPRLSRAVPVRSSALARAALSDRCWCVYDALGISAGGRRFVRNFMTGKPAWSGAGPRTPRRSRTARSRDGALLLTASTAAGIDRTADRTRTNPPQPPPTGTEQRMEIVRTAAELSQHLAGASASPSCRRWATCTGGTCR